jgi:proteic killer suppression protein
MFPQVIISRKANKQLAKVPDYIREKLEDWAKNVQTFGIQEVRKNKGYHDEPLKGVRLGERSIRLNKQWRAIYWEKDNGSIYIEVLEVTPHEYKK